MNNRVITRERGVIPGCRAPGPDSHMAVDGMGRPWTHSPSDIDAYLAKLRAETRQSRINRGTDPETGIKIVVNGYQDPRIDGGEVVTTMHGRVEGCL